MRIVVLTQDDPFFLPKAMPALKSGLPDGAEWVATVLFEVSPFGKEKPFGRKQRKPLMFSVGSFSYTIRSSSLLPN